MAGRALRSRVAQVAERLDPVPSVVEVVVGSSPALSYVVIGVYRSKNAATIRTLVPEQPRPDHQPRLWALDEVAPALRDWTSGVGPGGRSELLNRLAEGVPASAWLVVVDDDVEVVRGSIPTALRVADALGFDLAQPAHSRRSHKSVLFNLARIGVVARSATVVEVGPILLISPTIRADLFPLPEDPPMGWGIDVVWSDLAISGARAFGIVDAVRMNHLHPAGASYDDAVERQHLNEVLAERGVEQLQDLYACRRRWGVDGLRRLWSARDGGL